MSLRRALAAESVGTAALLATVVGSGILAEGLAGGNAAVALLANSLATAVALAVIITLLAPCSGAHLNPAVTLLAWADGDLPARSVPGYLAAQFLGALAGVALAHAMFGLALLGPDARPRSSPGLWLGEVVATVALLAVVRACRGAAPERAAALVALTVLAGYWATSSTFFANPAATAGRALTGTFAGIRPADAPAFLLAQSIGLGLVLAALRLGRRG